MQLAKDGLNQTVGVCRKRENAAPSFPVLQRRKEEGLDGLRGKTLESSASELNSSFLSIIF